MPLAKLIARRRQESTEGSTRPDGRVADGSNPLPTRSILHTSSRQSSSFSAREATSGATELPSSASGKMARRLIVALALSTASALVAPVPVASTARRQRPVVRDRVESKYRAPDAIDALLSPWLRRLDGVEVPGHRRAVVAATASLTYQNPRRSRSPSVLILPRTKRKTRPTASSANVD